MWALWIASDIRFLLIFIGGVVHPNAHNTGPCADS